MGREKKLSAGDFRAMFWISRNDHPGRKAAPVIVPKSVALEKRRRRR